MWTMTADESALYYRWDGEILKLEPWGDNSLRVRSAMMGDIKETDYALLKPKNKNVVIRTGEMQASIQNGNIKAILTINDYNNRCDISYYNQKGELLLQEAGTGGALNRINRCFKPDLGGDFQLTVSFASNPEERIYGMGQYQENSLDLKNCSLELAHRNSQASVPFYISSLGYGFLWHNPAIGHVNFSKNVTEWYAESTKQMDYWITAGDSPDEIEQAYAGVTGTVPLMPEYGLGFWQCKLRYWNQEQLLETAREYKKRDIPIDVIVCDFFHWPHMGDFRFEEEFWPDPEGMVQELREMGIELMVSVWPQIGLDSENYQEMRQKGLLVKQERGVEIGMRFGGDSMFFDATNPEARDYVWKKCKDNYYQNGIRIFWLDEAEPEYSVYDFDNYRYHMGPNVQIGNVYPQMYSRTFFDGMRAEGQENVLNLVRCAWAGSQRYGALVWSGDVHCDWETLRKQVKAGISMGIAGIPWWTTDIGGFSGGDPGSDEFRKLLIRWFEWGTFCPVMRLHGDRMPSKNLYRKDGSMMQPTGSDNEIWSFGDENYAIMKRYILLRELMRPYIRRIMKEAHETGTPVMRAMFYEFPDDTLCWELEEQYMFGRDILVAPVLYKDCYESKVYLPKGQDWIAYFGKKVYSGGQWICVPASLDEIPVFIRKDACEELRGLLTVNNTEKL
ncbi:alpha-D-xyloside xylohydrolase [Hungatella effluvii]|uniref:Alpha-D-xyloside xylohydrolase n=1 Tax=Hungatella effluvii TaxID=1096246 RepID=A0A2V3Y384_9FIRM|nr:TIM-barrel domain-containing protein [Hungatella effluvii]PXX52002.1 alpha-D-xyloside xylohydrolase [Hungatella effluvii]